MYNTGKLRSGKQHIMIVKALADMALRRPYQPQHKGEDNGIFLLFDDLEVDYPKCNPGVV